MFPRFVNFKEGEVLYSVMTGCASLISRLFGSVPRTLGKALFQDSGRAVSRPNFLPVPYRTPATQAAANLPRGRSFTDEALKDPLFDF